MSGLDLAAAIITFIDFGVKVVSRLHEFNSRTTETPETFRTLVIQLPLLNITLQRIRHQALAGYVDKDVVIALKPVIDEAAEQAKYLDAKLIKITPGASASSLERGLKALKSIVSESAVIKAVDKIDNCVNVLVLHHTTSSIDITANILEEIQKLAISPAPTKVKEGTIALLHEAARQGHLSSIRSIIRLPTEVDAADECGRTPLHTAASYGQKKAVQRLCFLKAYVNAEDDFGQTPLHVALLADHIEVASVLLERGASLDVKDDHGKKPLDYCKPSFLTRWRILHGMDIDAKDPKIGNTALIQAARQGDVDAVTFLLRQGAKVGATNHISSTALAEACVRGHAEVVSVLLDYKADTNTIDAMNWSPFMRCILNSEMESLHLLLDSRRIDLEATSSSRHQTALCEAVYNHQWTIVELLLKRGANPNVTSQNRSPLRCTILWCDDERVLIPLIEVFVQYKADLHAVDSDGWTAIRETISRRKFGAMKLLLQHGASANGTIGNEPWICTLVKWNVDIQWTQLLVSHGANLEATNCDGWTALREAVHWGHVDIVIGLLALGADSNNRVRSSVFFPGHDSVTMLMHATWNGHVWEGTRYRVIINNLLKHSARLEDEDSHGWTALRVAVEKGYEDIACLLLLKGANANTIAKDGRSAIAQAKNKSMREFCVMVGVTDTVI
jgi:ankyrin repeat protein